MSTAELQRFQERLRVEGRHSSRHSFLVGKVRRVLWPFIRSYHFLTLEWVRSEVENTTNRSAAELRSLIHADGNKLRALQAEVLAASRQTREAYDFFSELEGRLEVAAMAMTKLELRVQSQEAATDQAALQAHRLEERMQTQEATTNQAILQTQKLEERMQAVEAATNRAELRVPDGPDQRDWPRAVFPLGDAICVQAVFGPLIMKRDDLITEHVRRTGMWDAHLLPWMRAGAKRGSVAVDAGAHFGTLSVAMAESFARVHAIEASRESFLFLCANAALRPPGRIMAHNVGLYSTETEISLAPPNDQEIPIDGALSLEQGFLKVKNSGALTFSRSGTGVNRIRAVPLDSLDLQDVGFIKIDCQGSDGAVILGAIETIKRCRPIVVFEWEQHLAEPHGISLERVRAILREAAYSAEVAFTHNEKQVDYVATPDEG